MNVFDIYNSIKIHRKLTEHKLPCSQCGLNYPHIGINMTEQDLANIFFFAFNESYISILKYGIFYQHFDELVEVSKKETSKLAKIIKTIALRSNDETVRGELKKYLHIMPENEITVKFAKSYNNINIEYRIYESVKDDILINVIRNLKIGNYFSTDDFTTYIRHKPQVLEDPNVFNELLKIFKEKELDNDLYYFAEKIINIRYNELNLKILHILKRRIYENRQLIFKISNFLGIDGFKMIKELTKEEEKEMIDILIKQKMPSLRISFFYYFNI